MAGAIAPSSFSAGAKEAAATVDVYAKSANQTVNSIQDIRKIFDSDLLANLKGGNFSGGLSPIIRGLDKVGMLVDKSSLIGRLVGANPKLLAGFKDLTGGMGDSITGAFEDKDGVFATVGGVVSKVSGAVVDNVKSLGNLIGDVVGDAYDFVVTDNDAITGLYTGIIKEAQALGIPNSFSDMISTIRDPNIINRITSNVLPSIVGNSDTAGLLGAAIGTAQGVVKAINPQILSDFSRNYTNPLYRGVRDLQGQGNGIFKAFDAVDKLWDKGERILANGQKETVTNLSMIQGASKDAKAAIGSAAWFQLPDDSKDRTMYKLAEVFPPTTVHAEIKQDFPKATLSDDFELTGPKGYYEELAKQKAYSRDMSLVDKFKNIYL